MTFAKLLAAFGTRSGQIEGMHEFFDIWFGHMKPLFEAKTFVLKVLCLFIFFRKRERGEGSTAREITKNRAEFISFIKLLSVSLFYVSL